MFAGHMVRLGLYTRLFPFSTDLHFLDCNISLITADRATEDGPCLYTGQLRFNPLFAYLELVLTFAAVISLSIILGLHVKLLPLAALVTVALGPCSEGRRLGDNTSRLLVPTKHSWSHHALEAFASLLAAFGSPLGL